MISFQEVIWYICLSHTFIYGFILLWVCFGLFKKNKSQTGRIQTKTFSVIIPYRNEFGIHQLEENLAQAIRLYPHVEVIWVNDHSECGDHPKKMIPGSHLIQAGYETGKKQAIKLGIQKASHSHIITLDADIELKSDFFKKLNEEWYDQDMIILPVMAYGKNIIGKIFQVESLELLGLTIGSSQMRHPLMCNGAALGFRKSAYENVNIPHIDKSSGDDIFLLESFKKRQLKIASTYNPALVVKTFLPCRINDFIFQRLRWASKSIYYKDPFLLYFGFVVGLMNISLLICFFILMINGLPDLFLLTLGYKLVCEFLLLFLSSITTGVKFSWGWFLLLYLIYPFYSMVILILSLIIKPKWKGRQIT